MLFRKKIKYDGNYLEMTPYARLEHEINESGLVDVLVPKFKNKNLQFFLIPKRKSTNIRANLDEFGSATWLLIDGNNRVSDIANHLTERFGEVIQPVNDRLTVFLSELHRIGFISFKELEREK